MPISTKTPQQIAEENHWAWTTELHNNPDNALIAMNDHVVASADRIILQRCQSWWSLVNEVIDTHLDRAWILELG